MGTTTTTAAAAQKLSWIKCVVMRAEASKTHTLHIIYICTHTQTHTPRHTYTHANKPTNQSTLTPASVTLHTCTHTHTHIGTYTHAYPREGIQVKWEPSYTHAHIQTDTQMKQSYFHMSPPKAISVAKLKNYDWRSNNNNKTQPKRSFSHFIRSLHNFQVHEWNFVAAVVVGFIISFFILEMLNEKQSE